MIILVNLSLNSLQHYWLKIQRINLSEILTQNIFVTNQSKYEQMFEFGSPNIKLSGLTISPSCLVLKAGKTIRVEVVFDPSLIDFMYSLKMKMKSGIVPKSIF